MGSMVNGGWVKLYRELKSKSIWQLSSPQQKVVLITILLLANHEENNWEWNGEQFTCSPGQLITSLSSLARECGEGVTIRNVRTALDRFEKLGFLTNTSTKTGRLITIVNWGKYQGIDFDADKGSDKDLTKSRQGKSVTKVLNAENSTKHLTMLLAKNGIPENTVKSIVSEYSSYVSDKASDKIVTKSRQRPDKDLTPNKNDKELKNDKEEKKEPAALVSDEEEEWLNADELAKREGIDLSGDL